MKKSMYVLIMSVCVFLFAGADRVQAAMPYDDSITVLRTFSLSQNGVDIPMNGTVYVEPNDTLILDLTPLTTRGVPVATSGDIRNVSATLGIPEGDQNPNVGNVTVHVYYNPAARQLLISTPNGVVDGTLSVQLTTTVTDLNGDRSFLTDIYPIHLKTGPVTSFYYLFVPKSMSVRNSDGSRVSNVEMTASKSRTFEVWADDYNGDKIIDEHDYDVFPVNDLVMIPSIEAESESDLMGISTTPAITGKTPTMQTYPTRIAVITVTARNPGGTQGSTYDPVYTDFAYQIEFDGTTGSGQTITDVLPNEGVIETPRVGVRINALDDAGGDGEDSGGTCNASGMGALFFLVPSILIRKKTR